MLLAFGNDLLLVNKTCSKLASIYYGLRLVMISFRLSPNAGIAIGPILFIIAILALLAAAIAAGSGSFTSGTTNENAKVMAATLLQQAGALDDAVNLVRGQGYADTQISFTVTDNTFVDNGVDLGQSISNGYDLSSPACFGGGGSKCVCASDSCSVYKPNGGGIVPQAMPLNAADQSILAAYSGDTSLGCRAPVTMNMQAKIEGGTSAPIRLVQFYFGVSKEVCMALNNLVGVTNVGADAPTSTISYGVPKGYNMYLAFGQDYVFDNAAAFAASKDFCFNDTVDGFYAYMHVYR